MAKKEKFENVCHIYRIKLHNTHKRQKALFLFRYAAQLRKGIISILSFSKSLSRSRDSLMRLDRLCAFAVRWADMFCLDVPTRRFRPEVKKAQVHNYDAKLLVRHIQASFGSSGAYVQCVTTYQSSCSSGSLNSSRHAFLPNAGA